jgi:tetratricopeptide (TPR) repeat protein
VSADRVHGEALSDVNRVELTALERMIIRADGFRLGLAVVNHPGLRDRIAAALRADLPDRRFAEVALDSELDGGVVQAIERAALEKPTALLVSGLERFGEGSAGLGELNLNRDHLRRVVPFPVVFWLPDFAVRAFARTAADLWSGRSGLYRFAPEAGDAAVSAAGAASEISWLNPADERRDWEALLHDVMEELDEDDDPSARAPALAGLGKAALMRSRAAEASEHLDRARALYRSVGDRLGEANALKGLGDAAGMQGRYEDAIALFEQALAAYRELGDRLGEANALKSLGDAAGMQGRYEDAIALFEQALAAYRELGDRLSEANALLGLGRTLAATGSPAASNVLSDAARIYETLADHERAKHARQLIRELPQPATG